MEKDLKTEFDRLHIISFDSNGVTTKKDVFSALEAIEKHMNLTPDAETLKHIQKLKEKKANNFFKG